MLWSIYSSFIFRHHCKEKMTRQHPIMPPPPRNDVNRTSPSMQIKPQPEHFERQNLVEFLSYNLSARKTYYCIQARVFNFFEEL